MELFRRQPKTRIATGRVFALFPIATSGPSHAVVWLEWVHWAYDRQKGGFALISGGDWLATDPMTLDVDRPHKITAA